MGKAKAHPDQFDFDFSTPAPATGEAALAGLEKRVNAIVGVILNSAHMAGRTREVIAAEMSALLGEKVSRKMLDAYSSPAREDHKVPFSRLLALIIVTNRQDMLDPLLREGGMGVLVGEEVSTARIGHLMRVRAEADAELRKLNRTAPRIRGGKY